MNVMFSEPQQTIEAAQALYTYELFDPAAIFQDANGLYALVHIREMESPPHETADRFRAHGYVMVAYADPVLPVWRPYEGAR